jgi:hypothetical protein
MFAKYLRLLSVLLICQGALSSDFQYFESGIDYWSPKGKTEETHVPIAKPEPLNSQPSFDWKKHLDPKNPEFFKEGDYTPPEPFMELVRNPTDENIRNWFRLIDTKNELADRMQKRIAEYIARNQGTPESRVALRERAADIKPVQLNAKLYRFRFYFDSTCPHCHKMFETVTELERLGYYVEAFQVDKRNVPLPGLSVPVAKAKPEDLKKLKIESVPLLLVGDLKKKVVYRLTGFQTVDSIMSAIVAEQNKS